MTVAAAQRQDSESEALEDVDGDLALVVLKTLGTVVNSQEERTLLCVRNGSLFLIDVVMHLVNRLEFVDTLFEPINVVRYALELAGALILIRLFYAKVVGVDGAEQLNLKIQIERILDSGQFLTALRETLPRGAHDDKCGLDYIPYLLHNLLERQRVFASRARYCLIATITLGIVFSSAVMYFGWILVNEAAAGTGKAVAELRDTSQSMDRTLSLMLPSYFQNPIFQREVAHQLDRLEKAEPGAKNQQLGVMVAQAINTAKSSGDFQALLAVLESATGKVSRGSDLERQYSTALNDAFDHLQRFLTEGNGAILQLPSALKNLNDAVSRVDASLGKPENRTPEILKRLAIGFAVATFFIVILRYTSGSYRLNYQQELKTMLDDDAVRRFYVGYKGSGASDDQRKAVLAAFMASPVAAAAPGSAGGEASGLSGDELSVFKEIIAALAKKL